MSGSRGMQRVVNTVPAPAVKGDFSDSNPRASFTTGPGGLRAGPNGVTIGNFAWVDLTDVDPSEGPTFVNNTGVGPVSGFVHREQQGLILQYLEEFGMQVPAGMGLTIMESGGYWMENEGTTPAVFGNKVFANLTNGSAAFGAAGAAIAGYVETEWRAVSNALPGELCRCTAVKAP